jgi:hypothetical protein
MPRKPTALQLPTLYPKQAEIASSLARFRIVATGRQTGKSLMCAEELLVAMLNYGHACWLVAPDYRRTSYVLNYLLKFTHNVPTVHYYKKDMRFECDNGGYIQLASADDPKALKGDTLDFVVIDEAAFLKPEAWYESIRPMLTVRRGRALLVSTLFGRNWFWELWNYADSKQDKEWEAFKFPTSASPFQSEEELESIRKNTPSGIYAQEYLAEPLSDNALVFRGLDDVCILGEDEPQRHHMYIAGIDFGNARDYTVLHILDVTPKPMRSVAKYRFNEIGYAVQREWLKSKVAYWKPSLIIAEQNSIGVPNIEQLRLDGIRGIVAFDMNPTTKPPLIQALALGIEERHVLLLADLNLKAELAAYEVEQTASGHYKYNAPKGQHDDEVVALALAYFGASGEYLGQNKIRYTKATGLYNRDAKPRTYPTWGRKVNVTLPR